MDLKALRKMAEEAGSASVTIQAADLIALLDRVESRDYRRGINWESMRPLKVDYTDWSKKAHAYEDADSSPAAGSIADMIGAWPCKKCGAAKTDAMHIQP